MKNDDSRIKMKFNNGLKSQEIDNLEGIIKDNIDNIKLNYKTKNINLSEDNQEKSLRNMRGKSSTEKMEIGNQCPNIEQQKNSLKESNLNTKKHENIKLEGNISGNKNEIKNNNINEIKSIDNIEENNCHNFNMKLDSLDEKIQLKKGDISTNNNLKEEIIEKEMPLFKNKIKTGNQNDLMKIKQNKENIKISQNIENESLNKEKDNKIYESITGSIIGTPRQKNIVEYGSTKGYKRPNIKKGKDFTHNPEILIEGTISGIKNIFKENFENNINSEEINNHLGIENNSKLNGKYSINISNDKREIKYDEEDKKININKSGRGEIEITKQKNINGNIIEETFNEIKDNMNMNINHNVGKNLKQSNTREHVDLKMKNLKDNKIKSDIPGNNKNLEENINIPHTKTKENNTEIQLKKEKEKQIFESITGSIIGTPRQKNIVEYGSSKGYKRPNIKKGKDFNHSPVILIEGTINGTKNIPPTLKSIFQDKINTNIQLNKKVNNQYKIKEEDVSEYFIILQKPEIKENSSDLKLGNTNLNNSDFMMKKEILEGKIKEIELNQNNKDIHSNISLKSSSKASKDNKINDMNIINGRNDLKNLSKGRSNISKEEIITGIIAGKNKNEIKDFEKISVESKKGTIVNINNRPNIPNDKQEDKKIIKTESITGSIIGTPRQKNIVEYGSTKGYKRPNIKKGKDFTHNPEILIEGTISGIKNIELRIFLLL